MPDADTLPFGKSTILKELVLASFLDETTLKSNSLPLALDGGVGVLSYSMIRSTGDLVRGNEPDLNSSDDDPIDEVESESDCRSVSPSETRREGTWRPASIEDRLGV